jgi:hypothetical protein
LIFFEPSPWRQKKSIVLCTAKPLAKNGNYSHHQSKRLVHEHPSFFGCDETAIFCKTKKPGIFFPGFFAEQKKLWNWFEVESTQNSAELTKKTILNSSFKTV